MGFEGAEFGFLGDVGETQALDLGAVEAVEKLVEEVGAEPEDEEDGAVDDADAEEEGGWVFGGGGVVEDEKLEAEAEAVLEDGEDDGDAEDAGNEGEPGFFLPVPALDEAAGVVGEEEADAYAAGSGRGVFWVLGFSESWPG